MGRGKGWTPEQIALVKTLLVDGKNLSYIAERRDAPVACRVPRPQASGFHSLAGIPRRDEGAFRQPTGADSSDLAGLGTY